MTVRFTASLTIDTDEWNAEYGKAETPNEIRRAVLTHCDDLVRTMNAYRDEISTIATNA